MRFLRGPFAALLARMAALSCFPVAIWAFPIFQAIPPNKHIRRGVASRAALILGVDRTFAVSFHRLGQKDGLRLAFAPYGREPRLLAARKSRRAVVVSHLVEPGSSNVIAPGVEIEEAAIAAIAKAFLVVSSWV